MAHQLARFCARRGESHPIDDVIQPALEKLQEILAGRTLLLRGPLVVVVELPLEHTVHTTQLLLFTQLQTVV